MKINNFVQKTANYIEKSPKIQKILRFADKNPSIFGSAIVFTTATTLRPVSILMTSRGSQDQNKKKDSVYSAARSIATGIVDIVFTALFFIPLGKILDKRARNLYNSSNTVYFQNKEACSMYKSILNRGIDILLLPLMAYASFKYLKPISKRIYNNEDKK